jgi:hypothetical protein
MNEAASAIGAVTAATAAAAAAETAPRARARARPADGTNEQLVSGQADGLRQQDGRLRCMGLTSVGSALSHAPADWVDRQPLPPTVGCVYLYHAMSSSPPPRSSRRRMLGITRRKLTTTMRAQPLVENEDEQAIDAGPRAPAALASESRTRERERERERRTGGAPDASSPSLGDEQAQRPAACSRVRTMLRQTTVQSHGIGRAGGRSPRHRAAQVRL